MSKTFRIINLVAFVVTIGMNYLSNSGFFNGQTIGSVAANFPTPITPAPYAFSIWSLIYFGLAAFVIYHFRSTPEAQNGLQKVGAWFLYSCFLNCCWVLAWVYGHIGWSVIIIGCLLLSLIRIIIRTDMELTDPPASTVVFLWWPFCLYLGWILLAFAVNVSVWITQFPSAPRGLGINVWSLILLIGAGLAYLGLTWWRNMREAAAVGAWGLFAIGWADRNNAPALADLAWFLTAVLVTSSGIHAYRNRKFGPFRKRS
jgi:hypothetical protein